STLSSYCFNVSTLSNSNNLLPSTLFCKSLMVNSRESSGELTIKDLQNRVEGSKLLELDNVETLKQYDDSVLVFMGAGDIQKFQTAYEESVKKDSTRA